MQFDKHETDLYILPETQEERKRIYNLLETKFSTWFWSMAKSNVKGQSWEGKMFFDIPFGIYLKEEIISLMKG